MLTKYIEGAMRRAKYEILSDDDSFYGEIPGFDGVYANAIALEECREELEEVLEESILFRVSRNLPLPVIDGIELAIKESSLMPSFGPIKRDDLIRYLRRQASTDLILAASTS